jgi:exo-1,4-beta-D-glucosaminidase
MIALLLPAAALAADGRADLTTGWRIQSSAKIGAGGDAISTREFVPTSWTDATVPTTVVAAQLAAGQFEDPFFAKNLRKLPGATYPIAVNFAHLPMPADSPYASSWWYRTEFRVPAAFAGRRVRLHFDGINYRANVWLNGRKIAGSDDVAGAYRTYEFDVTDALSSDAANVLAVETFAPTEHDLAINWVDWSPMPPDKELGLWGDVYLTASGPVAIRYPFVATRFADDKLRRADLTVAADLVNTTDRPVDGVLEGTIGAARFEQPVSLAPGERRTVRFTPDRFAQLRVDDPKVWWPAPLGPQNLDTLALSFTAGGAVSDTATVRFGIREVTSELTQKGHRLFRVNRKPILIRGAGWAPDMFLRRPSPERLNTELEYVRDMNLNTIRLEGKMESDAFYEACDRMGILVMAGWCCCDHWEEWDKWKPGDLAIATASVRSQTLRLRSHPSALVWLNGSDNPPPPEVEKAYIKELEAASWPNPYLSNATATPTTVTGPSGVKMEGPYDYVTPSYWTRDVKYGGAFGFATEIGPGPAIPTAGSLRRMLPKDHLWPIDEVWSFHAGGQEFKTLHIFDSAMRKSYGAPADFDDYVDKAQAMTYDSERAMFEAYGKNKYTSTGVIQWMLNNSWPSLIWHLYDYYLQPAGGYYGTKKACEPLHIQYAYDDRGVVVVNSLYQGFTGLRASAKVYDFDLRETFSNEATVDAPEDSARPAFAIPEKAIAGGGVHFVRLELRDADGRVVSTNFYWLPAKYATYAWDKTTFVSTPIASHEDLTALARLPRVEVEATARANGDRVEVRLRNAGAHLAFQVHATVLAGEGREEVAPIFWDDNYVTLMPGETRVLVARIGSRSGPLAVGLDGMNIGTRAVALANGEGH